MTLSCVSSAYCELTVNYVHNDHVWKINSRIDKGKKKVNLFLKIHTDQNKILEDFQKCPLHVHVFLKCVSFANCTDPSAVLVRYKIQTCNVFKAFNQQVITLHEAKMPNAEETVSEVKRGL